MLVYGIDPYKAKKQDYLIAQPSAERDGHPCQKPERAWRWLVGRVTKDGQSVLDPFMGSGTTLVVAKQMGHKAIGCDVEERYCEIAANRLAQRTLDLATEESA